MIQTGIEVGIMTQTGIEMGIMIQTGIEVGDNDTDWHRNGG